MSEPTITLYTKPSCVQCDATKRTLDQLGATYRVIDLTQDSEAMAHVTETLGYRQAPVVETASGQHWSGFRPDLLRQQSAITTED